MSQQTALCVCGFVCVCVCVSVCVQTDTMTALCLLCSPPERMLSSHCLTPNVPVKLKLKQASPPIPPPLPLHRINRFFLRLFSLHTE